MERILLDTNVLSELMRPQPEQAVVEWFVKHENAVFYACAITQAEILLGIAILPDGKRKDSLEMAAEMMFREDFTGRILPFDESAAAHYAALVAARRKTGQPMTTEDAQIAAIALSHDYSLATRNTKDFLHIDTLTLFNPWDPS
jgi:predicted nucleic acid-binding protein